ncbi:MAG TPA: hypothetical protein VMJ32_15055 [Pirellulales bacterium]|nr:hypothetical protein [Pirellulales bacterium]
MTVQVPVVIASPFVARAGAIDSLPEIIPRLGLAATLEEAALLQEELQRRR